MSIEIIPICYDCNEELSNWDRFLNKKYPNTLGYTLCSQCEKRREEKKKEFSKIGINTSMTLIGGRGVIKGGYFGNIWSVKFRNTIPAECLNVLI